MIPLLTSDQVRTAEQAAVEAGVGESELMIRAGYSVADQLDSAHAHPGSVLVLCGPGRNGGDGILVASRLIEIGWSVAVWTWERERIGDAPVEGSPEESITWVSDAEELNVALSAADVVVDAVFGAGSRAELPEIVSETFALVAGERSRRHLDVWALDLPSGIDSTTGDIAEGALAADITAMIGLPKVGAYRFPAARFTGYIVLIDIGLEAPEAVPAETPRLMTALDARAAFPERRAGVHKRTAGTLMVVGGAPHYYGAPRLTGEAALRAGAGLVSIAAPSSIIAPIATAVPELTFVPLPVAEHSTAANRMANIVREQSTFTDAFVIGPGLGTDAPVPEFLSFLFGFEQPGRVGIGFGTQAEPDPVELWSRRAVLDADALNWLANQEEWSEKLSSAELVLTPHPGELGRLLGIERSAVESDPWGHAIQAAQKFGQVVVLKFGHTVVATPSGELYVADQAPPSLASAGTGDVLAGIIGAFLAQGCSATSSAITGIVLGLRATALAEEAIGTIGITASEIARFIPQARDEITHARTAFE